MARQLAEPAPGQCWICGSAAYHRNDLKNDGVIPDGAKQVKILEHVKGSTARGRTLYTLCWVCWQQVKLAVKAIRK